MIAFSLYIREKLNFAFAWVLIQLALALSIVYFYELEQSSGLQFFAPLILVSFFIFHLVSKMMKPWVFFLQSLTIVFTAFGWFSGALLLAGTFIVYSVLRFDLRPRYKIIFLLIFFATLAVWRSELLYMPRIQIFVPFLAGFFMFRAWIYINDRYYHNSKASFINEFNFFFLGPSVCFPLFPILDFKRYTLSLVSEPTVDLYQKGIDRMLAGIVNLLLFRIVYHYFYISPAHIEDGLDFFQFFISTFLLVIRVPGMFLFISGWLCLFGMNLPPVFGRFMFAYNFSEVWRRINIYWKDFLIKIFYNRIFIFFKNGSINFRFATATVATFILSAFLHSWQLYWISGQFYVHIEDLIYWTVLALLVHYSSMRESRSRVHQNFVKDNLTFSGLLLHGSSVFVVFVGMAFLYAYWMLGDSREWLYLFSTIRDISISDILNLILLSVGSIILFSVAYKITSVYKKAENFISVFKWITPAFLILAIVIRVYDPVSLKKIIYALPNASELEKIENDYYDFAAGTVTGERLNWELQLNRKKPEFFNSDDQLHKRRADILTRELRPSVTVTLRGSTYTTNSFGLRDKEYATIKPYDCRRYAMLGASYTMGYGVNDGESFEALLEDTLSRENCVEILNFGVGSYGLIQQVALLDQKIQQFSPDGVIYTAHSREKFRVTRTFVGLVQNGVDLEYPELISIKERAGMKQYMSYNELFSRARKYSDELLNWGYDKIIYYCSRNNIIPVMIFIQATMDENDKAEWDEIRRIASTKGFIVLDASNAYLGREVVSLQVSSDDHHPNQEGHRLIMRALYNEWKKQEVLNAK